MSKNKWWHIGCALDCLSSSPGFVSQIPPVFLDDLLSKALKLKNIMFHKKIAKRWNSCQSVIRLLCRLTKSRRTSDPSRSPFRPGPRKQKMMTSQKPLDRKSQTSKFLNELKCGLKELELSCGTHYALCSSLRREPELSTTV